MEDRGFNKVQIRQLADMFTGSERRIRKDIVDQADLTKRELREEFAFRFDALEQRLKKEIRKELQEELRLLRLDIGEMFDKTVYT